MAVNIYREYRLKFYLNMRHYIIINDTKGETHPHTWEFALDIKFARNSFVEFNIFENGITQFLEQYQNKTLNEVAPFDSMMPTIENVTDYFAEEFLRLYTVWGECLQASKPAKHQQEVILLIYQSRTGMRFLIRRRMKESCQMLWMLFWMKLLSNKCC